MYICNVIFRVLREKLGIPMSLKELDRLVNQARILQTMAHRNKYVRKRSPKRVANKLKSRYFCPL
jgi:hypothetical protein